MKKKLLRLDAFICQIYPNLSKTYLQSMIMQGKVVVDGVKIVKAGTSIKEGSIICLEVQEPIFVSRAGFKLQEALEYFAINAQGLTVLDAGISTGGFTDCLLQRGAATIYGVDVGYGQVHEKIKKDARVRIFERTNLRTLDALPSIVDLVTLDLSFISVLKVIENVKRFLKQEGGLVVLIKPQFEAEKKDVAKGGIIRDEKVHKAVIQKVTQGIESHGFHLKGVIDSPITGTDGNKEFLAYFQKM